MAGAVGAVRSTVTVATGDCPLVAPVVVFVAVTAKVCGPSVSGNSGVVPGLYHPAATLYAPGHCLCTGEQEIGAQLSGYRASFADSETQLHHLIVRKDPNEPIRLSLRWSLLTWHDGYGKFGAPTRKPISITGISQLELRDGLIFREYLGIDELAIWSQIFN